LLTTPIWLKRISIGKNVDKFKDYKSPGCMLKQRHIGAFN